MNTRYDFRLAFHLARGAGHPLSGLRLHASSTYILVCIMTKMFRQSADDAANLTIYLVLSRVLPKVPSSFCSPNLFTVCGECHCEVYYEEIKALRVFQRTDIVEIQTVNSIIMLSNTVCVLFAILACVFIAQASLRCKCVSMSSLGNYVYITRCPQKTTDLPIPHGPH